jgi:hypothetical protein
MARRPTDADMADKIDHPLDKTGDTALAAELRGGIEQLRGPRIFGPVFDDHLYGPDIAVGYQ